MSLFEFTLYINDETRHLDNLFRYLEIKTDKNSLTLFPLLFHKDKLPTAVRLLEKDNNLYKLTFIVCGAIVAVLISAAALFYVKKQSQTKDKILISRDKEFGKDYEVVVYFI